MELKEPKNKKSVPIWGEFSDEEEYRTYIEHRNQLIQASDQQYRQLTKQILVLSSGAIAISLIFIEKVAPDPRSETLWLLFVCWVSLILSLALTVVSFLVSGSAYEIQIKRWDELFSTPVEDRTLEDRQPLSRLTNTLTVLSLLTFVIGILSLCAFAFVNVNTG